MTSHAHGYSTTSTALNSTHSAFSTLNSAFAHKPVVNGPQVVRNAANPSIIPPSHTNRTLVLCFDGTGDQFDADVSIFQVIDRLVHTLGVELEYHRVFLHAQERRPNKANGLLSGIFSLGQQYDAKLITA